MKLVPKCDAVEEDAGEVDRRSVRITVTPKVLQRVSISLLPDLHCRRLWTLIKPDFLTKLRTALQLTGSRSGMLSR
jgi:hypothetical protein